MYLWSMTQHLPLTPGLSWTLKNGRFRKNVLVGDSSFSSIQWLYFQQTKYKERIHHAYFQGEKTVYGCKVDGYAVINGKETIFEYNGCYHHGCPCIKDRTNQQIQKQIQWQQRKQKFEANGCTVISTTCCQWKPFLDALKTPPKTEMGRILLHDNPVIYTCYKLHVKYLHMIFLRIHY